MIFIYILLVLACLIGIVIFIGAVFALIFFVKMWNEKEEDNTFFKLKPKRKIKKI